MTMHRTISLVLACSLILLAAGTSCRNEDDKLKQGDLPFQMKAASLPMEGGDDAQAKDFAPATTYALFAVASPSGGSRNWASPALNTVGVEGENGYIEYVGRNSFLDNTLDFYGLTLGEARTDSIYTPSNPDRDAIEYDPALNAAPVYHIEGEVRSGQNGNFYTFPDLRRAELLGRNADNSSYILQMPFKHCLSKLIIEISRQEHESLEDLRISHIELLDVPVESRLNVETNTFEHASDRQNILLYENPGSELVPTRNPDSLTETLILPYNPAENNNQALQLRIHTNKPGIGENGVETCRIETAYVDDNGQVTYPPLALESNVIYTIRLTVTTDEVRILTVVPSYYEWIDEDLSLIDMGTPVNFNGVFWSDRNLGASNANPLASADAWNQSVGYFYQFGRNIPYFPNDYNARTRTVDLNTPLSEALSSTSSRTAYPVVDLASWDLGNVSSNNILWPTSNSYGNNAIWQIGEIPNNRYNNYKLLGYYNNASSIPDANAHWSNKENHPCPAGWRLPTAEDWRSIMPYSPISGNFALRVFTQANADGSWYTNNTYAEPDFESEYASWNLWNIQTPTGGNSPYNSATQAYTGGFPYLQRVESNDPRSGRTSTYVISFDEEDRTRYTCTNPRRTPYQSNAYTYNWGIIYCIKNQGTSEAYRLRWRIELVGTEAEKRQDPRSVIVVERFPATAQDQLTYQNVKTDFDWSHPVEVLYLPITGMLSPSWPANQGGNLFNIGGEAAYASSDPHPSFASLCYGCWVKTVGDNMTNMQISASSTTKGFGMQVRCVRDLEY